MKGQNFLARARGGGSDIPSQLVRHDGLLCSVARADSGLQDFGEPNEKGKRRVGHKDSGALVESEEQWCGLLPRA